MTTPKVVDLFSGVGGLSLGISEAGADVVLAVDNNEKALEAYNSNFPDKITKNLDLSTADQDDILSNTGITKEEVDIVTGGPPCQGFSVMGKRDPDDERNNLLLKYAEHISGLSPDYFVMENVKGLMSGDKREFLEEFLNEIRSAGYNIVEPIQVLDAAEFGVPQYRERVIVLGYRDTCPKPSYPTPDDSNVNSWDAIGDLPNNLDDVENGVYKGELGPQSDYVKKINSWKQKASTIPEGITGLDPVDHSERVRNRFADVDPGSNDEVSRYYRLKKTEPSVTLRAGSSPDRGTHTPARPIHPVAPRCITVREAARIQSFPDWFQFSPTKYHGLRQIGNSVPPLLAKCIGDELLECYTQSKAS
ncbi:modification methylase XorII [Natrinema thermotolerans DSM 11552]|nr:modification methylase XorII [Natrinema thermotolerans DSM 11552]